MSPGAEAGVSDADREELEQIEAQNQNGLVRPSKSGWN